MTMAVLKLPIEELCVQVTSGGTPSRKNAEYWQNGNINWLKTGELNDWYVGESEEKINQKGLDGSSAKLFPANTVLMAMYGDGKTITTLGVLNRPATTNQACCAMIVDGAKCNYLYLLYALKHHRNELLKLVVAGAQRNLSTGIIKKFPVTYFPLPKQERIADYLSSYDKLIENNRRRIQLLEESARLLYQEWFVHLRFPGHEQVKITDGVPEGWGKKPLTAIAEVNQTSLKKGFDERIEYIDISCVSTHSISDTTWYEFAEAPGRARRIVKHCDILWSCVRPNRRSHVLIWEPHDRLIASTGFAVISATQVSPFFLYQSLTTNDYVGYLTNRAGGAAYPAVTAKVFEESLVLVPSCKLIEQYDDQVKDTYAQINMLRSQNAKLAQARDLLLPKLMSGELTI